MVESTNGQSVEAEALEIFTAKKKAEAMRKELKDWISFSMGPSAWDELVATEGRIRKQKKEQEYRKAEMIEAIITWSNRFAFNYRWVYSVLYYIWWHNGKKLNRKTTKIFRCIV